MKLIRLAYVFLLSISINILGCGTLGGFDNITFPITRKIITNAIDTLYIRNPKYIIPGKWKKYESKARKLSQTDSLFIICINQYKYTYIDHFNVPEVCYKFVYTISGKYLFGIGLTNSIATAGEEVEIPEKIKKEVEELLKK